MDTHSLLGRGTIILIIGIILLTLSSCGTTRYVPQPYPVPEIHEMHTIDTIRETYKDSTVVSKKNDTVFVDHWHNHGRDRWHKKVVHDSIPYPVEVAKPYPVEVVKPYYTEKEMPWYKRASMYAGYVLFLYLIFILLRQWKRLK